MATERESPGWIDFVVTALSPALVMLMVGSLVFFLVEVLYGGQYSERLLYTMFFFVFGVVLVARISIQYDAARAAVYGLGLAVVTYIAILAYVDYPPGWLRAWGWFINLLLLGLIGWSAYRLTWDCTHLDEKDVASGRGILNAAGWEADSPSLDSPPPRRPKKRRQPQPLADSRLWAWIERYQAYREAQRRAGHTPGVWVLYFAVAALPLFALGQSLIDPHDSVRRWNTFLQMTVYLASALGLLVTTSLLGVRRYLRQRKARIPASLTGAWLFLGGGLIAVFLTLGALLPRPHSEVPWFGLQRVGHRDRDASRYAQLGDAAGQNTGRPLGEPKTRTNKLPEANPSTSHAPSTDPDDKKSGKNAYQSQPPTPSGSRDSPRKSSPDPGSRNDPKSDNGSTAGGSKRATHEQTARNGDREPGDDDSRSASWGPLSRVVETIAQWAKWLVFAIVVAAIIITLVISILKSIAPFTDWAQRWLDSLGRWWAALWGGSGRSRKRSAETATSPSEPLRLPPFHHFSNPFADGSAPTRSMTELVNYTFAAFASWAWEHNIQRQASETPLEWANRAGALYPEAAESFHQLASLYTCITYSTTPLPPNAGVDLKRAWDQMVEMAT
ncbi:MAG: DUF4129 domain-containing protein [Gemmataceae bacterium]|nr:DUF4129 domain-containing protein [Gemmata sp.]MDW8199104.1 DUF4129 domain-containing protein [Gemmataceae bacterium]